MQTNTKASLGCREKMAFHLNSQESRNPIKDFYGIKEDINSRSADFVDSDHSFYGEGSSPMHQWQNRPFYQQEGLMWPFIYPGIQLQPQRHMNVFDNHFFPMNREGFYPVEHEIHHMPYDIVPQGCKHEHQFQEFQYFVVIDFEATCEKNSTLHPQEIIEFPSVLVNSSTGLQEDSFQTYVRPVHHQLLTDFCKELTGIQQSQVDRGVSLSDALLMHDKWLEDKGIKLKNFAVVTWSNWDCSVMLESECRLKGIKKPPYFNQWINLRVPFHEVFGDVRCNLKEAVELAGITWEGRAHCGLDDARNTASLLSLIMSQGFRFSITNSSVTQHSIKPADRQMDPAAATQQLMNSKEKMAISRVPRSKPSIEPIKDGPVYCNCGVKSRKYSVGVPGPTEEGWFFGCGNWTLSRGAVCDFFAFEEKNNIVILPLRKLLGSKYIRETNNA